MSESTMRITTPAGRPPIALEGTLPEQIDDWALALTKDGRYTINALQYWVRYFYEIPSQEHKLICQYLKENGDRLGIPYSEFKY